MDATPSTPMSDALPDRAIDLEPEADAVGPGRWLAKGDAARLLGISERGLERRLSRGLLPRRRRHGIAVNHRSP